MDRRGKPKKRDKTVDAIERLRRQREERRRTMEEAKRSRAAEDAENEAAGRPGDVDFQRKIKAFRRGMRGKPAAHMVDKRARVTVVVRKRPVSAKEVRRKDFDSVTCFSPTVYVHYCKLKVDGITKVLDNNEFRFDNVFDESSTNEVVYKFSAKPLVDFLFQGGTATCLAYGQTGSGKTYTMAGIQRLAARDVFRYLRADERRLSVTVSFFEIYGGRAFDLLHRRRRLTIREDARGKVQVQGLSEVRATETDELLQIIADGNAQRTTHATEMNADSSRSHALCQIQLREVGSKAALGKLYLVDLAGSERGTDTKNHNRQRRMESAEINKSLLSLKECIRAMDNGSSHVPFRASKLTLVLKDAFTKRKAKTVMISNISPVASSADHTINTLRYAQRLKVVTARPSGLDLAASDDDVDSEGEEPRAPVMPLSPTAARLHTASVLEREGRISKEEKARMKEDIFSGKAVEGFDGEVGRVLELERRLVDDDDDPGRPPRGRGGASGGGGGGAAGSGARGGGRRRSERGDRLRRRGSSSVRGGRDEEHGGERRRRRRTSEDDMEAVVVDEAGADKLRASRKRDDLELLHRSLALDPSMGSSDDLLELHEVVDTLVEEEDRILNMHMNAIQENADLLTAEGQLLGKVQGEEVVDYDIEEYVEELDAILTRKMELFEQLQRELALFRRHLREEEQASRRVARVPLY